MVLKCLIFSLHNFIIMHHHIFKFEHAQFQNYIFYFSCMIQITQSSISAYHTWYSSIHDKSFWQHDHSYSNDSIKMSKFITSYHAWSLTSYLYFMRYFVSSHKEYQEELLGDEINISWVQGIAWKSYHEKIIIEDTFCFEKSPLK